MEVAFVKIMSLNPDREIIREGTRPKVNYEEPENNPERIKKFIEEFDKNDEKIRVFNIKRYLKGKQTSARHMKSVDNRYEQFELMTPENYIQIIIDNMPYDSDHSDHSDDSDYSLVNYEETELGRETPFEMLNFESRFGTYKDELREQIQDLYEQIHEERERKNILVVNQLRRELSKLLNKYRRR